MHFFFLSWAPTHHIFLIRNSYTSWRTWFISLKTFVGFSIFDSVLFLSKFTYFCWTKSLDPLTLKHHNSFQNKNNRKTTHMFAPRPLIFKSQQEVWNFNDIFLNWSFHRLFKPRKSKLWVRHFFSITFLNIWHSFTY